MWRKGQPAAPSTPEPVTYVVSPHPDDETIRLTGFVTWTRFKSPHSLVLVAIGDGGASAQARRMEWSPAYEQEYRRAEQAAAWSALTGGTGRMIRLGLMDWQHTPDAVHAALEPLVGPHARFVVAAHPDDYHADHLAVVEGVRRLATNRVRFALSPLMDPGPTEPKLYRPPRAAADAVSIAVRSYHGAGQQSVRGEFKALTTAGYCSRLTA